MKLKKEQIRRIERIEQLKKARLILLSREIVRNELIDQVEKLILKLENLAAVELQKKKRRPTL